MADFKVWAAYCVHRDIKVKVFTLTRMLEKCPNPEIKIAVLEGDALIDRSRSRMATDFLRSDAEVLIFLDDDILFDPLDIRKLAFVCREMKSIVGGAYVLKNEKNPKFAVRFLGEGDYMFGKEGGLVEGWMASTGCMAVHREVFEKMIAEHRVHYCSNSGTAFYPFFTPYTKRIDGKWEYLSEDWAFCENARELGFKVWFDTTIKLGHIGPKIFDWDDIPREQKKVSENLLYSVRTPIPAEQTVTVKEAEASARG